MKRPIILAGHTNGVMSAAFSPDGKLLASCGVDKTAKLWDLQKGSELAVLRGHRHSVECVCFSPDGKILATGAHDSTIKLWDVESRKEIGMLLLGTSFVHDVVFSPDGKTLATRTGFNGILKLWNIDTRKERASRNRFGETGHRLCYFPDGRSLAAIASDGSLQFLNAKNGKTQFTLKSRGSKLEGLAISPDGKTLVFQGKIWDAETKKVRRSLKGFPEGNVRSLSFSPDGKLLVSLHILTVNFAKRAIDRFAILQVWDAESGDRVAYLDEQNKLEANPHFFAVFSPDGSDIAVEGTRHRLMVIDLAKLLPKK